MYLFHNDYNQTAHPVVLKKLSMLCDIQMPGYGEDDYCKRAAKLIRGMCENNNLSVHFLVGGTQTNLTVTAAALRPHQAILAADTAHVNIHETGAIEATGHKVVTVSSVNGKVTADQIEKVASAQRNDENAEHCVQIKMVYISQATELGTIYCKSELEDISRVCKEYGLYLYLDGARLGYALEASDNDLTLCDIARLCDVFYIGGTKVGAMFGEAVVISNPTISEDFRYILKQHGAMLAKGWLLGQQFEALFEDALYFKIALHANKLADRIRKTLNDLGYRLYLPGSTNQVFAVLPDDLLAKLSEKFTFMLQEKLDNGHSVVRFCTSWATTSESVDALCQTLCKLSFQQEIRKCK